MDYIRLLPAAPGVAALAWLWKGRAQERALVSCELSAVTCTCESGSAWGAAVSAFVCGIAFGAFLAYFAVVRARVVSRLPTTPRGRILVD